MFSASTNTNARIRPKDYEYRFKKWTLRRNLHEKELMSIKSQLATRKQAGRTSVIVVSGIRWPESRILGRLDRHKGSWLSSGRQLDSRPVLMHITDCINIPDQPDVELLPDFLARVQTPTPLMLDLPEWPMELPWLQFNQHFRRGI